jgi:hypothetical protein
MVMVMFCIKLKTMSVQLSASLMDLIFHTWGLWFIAC